MADRFMDWVVPVLFVAGAIVFLLMVGHLTGLWELQGSDCVIVREAR